MIATGLRADGHREVLGVDVGDSENETFWTEFLRSLVDRNLRGVRLVVFDAHAGLKTALRRVVNNPMATTAPLTVCGRRSPPISATKSGRPPLAYIQVAAVNLTILGYGDPAVLKVSGASW